MAEVKRPENLRDLFGKDLTDWQISPVYFLQLRHSLMGVFPAIDRCDNVIIVPRKNMLPLVWDRLPRRSAQVSHFVALWHPEMGIGFNMDLHQNGDAPVLKIFSQEEIDLLTKIPGSFEWAPGLIQGSDFIHEPVFS